MKKQKKITVVILILMLVLFGFFIKRTFIGYRYSGVADTLNEIEVLKEIGLKEPFGIMPLESNIKYYVKMGYAGRSYVSILLCFKTNEKDFIQMFFHGLPYEQAVENWFHSKHKEYSGYVKKAQDVNDESSLSHTKEKIGYYLPSKELIDSVDTQDFYGYREMESHNRSVRSIALFDIENKQAMILIQSSSKGD